MTRGPRAGHDNGRRDAGPVSHTLWTQGSKGTLYVCEAVHMMRRAERQKAGSHTAHRSSSKTDDHTRDGEPPALRAEGRTRGVGRHRFHFMRRARGDSPRSKQWRSHARVKHSRRIIGLESCAYEARSAFEGRPVRVRFAKASRGENDGVGTGHHIIVFFLCFVFCWKVERQIGCARHGPWTRRAPQCPIGYPGSNTSSR